NTALEAVSRETCEDQQKQQGNRRAAEDSKLPLTQHFERVGSAGDEAAFAKNFVVEKVAQEESAVLVPGAILGQLVERKPGGECDRFVERFAFPHGRSEVDTAEKDGFGGPFAGDEDGLEIAPQSRRQSHDAFRKSKQRVYFVQLASLADT